MIGSKRMDVHPSARSEIRDEDHGLGLLVGVMSAKGKKRRYEVEEV